MSSPEIRVIRDRRILGVQAHRRRIEKAFAARLPDYVGAEVVRSVSGVYDVTPDYHPILGWSGGIERGR